MNTPPITNEQGFSLLEMLTVLAILSLIASIAYTRYDRNSNDISAVDFAQTIQLLLAAERSRSLSTGANYQITFDLENRQIIGTKEKRAIPDDMLVKITTGRNNLRSEGLALISFSADGSSIGAVISITRIGEPVQTINIHWLTGAISYRENL